MLYFKISQLEEEIHKDWQAKCDRMLAVAAEKHNRSLQTVTEEKQELEDKIEKLENKVMTCYRHICIIIRDVYLFIDFC